MTTRNLRAGDIFNVTYGFGTALMDEKKNVLDFAGTHTLVQLSESFYTTQANDYPLTVHFALAENGRIVLHYACTAEGTMRAESNRIKLLHS